MRFVFENRAEAAAMADRGRTSIRDALNPARTAAEIAARVAQVEKTTVNPL
jgi:hypothetical protein